MSRRVVKNIRAVKRFDDFLRHAAKERLIKGTDKKYRFDSEMTDMMMNCPSFMKVAKELTEYPKKEDLK